jgi:hypothetical protein
MSLMLEYITNTLISLDILSPKESLTKKKKLIKQSKRVKLIDLNRKKLESIK